MMESQPRRTRGRTVGPLLAGFIGGVPTGFVLAYLAPLPFFLSLFFCMLLGLLIGATMFRLGRDAIPIPRGVLWGVGIASVLAIWITMLSVEYAGLPADAAQQVLGSIPRRLTADERATLEQQTREHILTQFSGRQAAGTVGDHVRAFPGYLRWVALDGRLDCPRVFHDSTHLLVLQERGLRWTIRVVLSLVLLTFGVMSQVSDLAGPRDRTEPTEVPPGAEETE
jgi:hypothetical protein